MMQAVWGWQPALYLFLGGMGAGAFIMASLLYLIDPRRHTGVVLLSLWAALASLGAGLLLLLSELTDPVRGLLMWQSFSSSTSWMAFGAWAALAAMAVFAMSAVLALPPVFAGLSRIWAWYRAHRIGVRKALAVVGMALGAFVAVYTGMLLMAAPGVPLWNTPLLPCLFAVSALDTGAALVCAIAVAVGRRERLAPRARRLMESIVVVLVVLECGVLAVFLASMLGADQATAEGIAAAQAAGALTSGELAPAFWVLVVLCGLAAPLALAAAGLSVRTRSPFVVNSLMAAGAAGALVGGCALRFLVLAAGVHADPVAQTVVALIG